MKNKKLLYIDDDNKYICNKTEKDCRFLFPRNNECDYIHSCKHKQIKISLNENIEFESIGCELSDEIKTYLEMLEWTHSMCIELLMIPKENFGNNLIFPNNYKINQDIIRFIKKNSISL